MPVEQSLNLGAFRGGNTPGSAPNRAAKSRRKPGACGPGTTRRHARFCPGPPSDLDHALEGNHSLATRNPAAIGCVGHDDKDRPAIVRVRPHGNLLRGAGGLGRLATGHAAKIVA
jgi:hypothetical protein